MAVVIVVLAVFLIPTAVALIQTNRNLDRLIVELERIRDNTGSLGSDLTDVNEAAVSLRDQLRVVDVHLQRSAAALRER